MLFSINIYNNTIKWCIINFKFDIVVIICIHCVWVWICFWSFITENERMLWCGFLKLFLIIWVYYRSFFYNWLWTVYSINYESLLVFCFVSDNKGKCIVGKILIIIYIDFKFIPTIRFGIGDVLFSAVTNFICNRFNSRAVLIKRCISRKATLRPPEISRLWPKRIRHIDSKLCRFCFIEIIMKSLLCHFMIRVIVIGSPKMNIMMIFRNNIR